MTTILNFIIICHRAKVWQYYCLYSLRRTPRLCGLFILQLGVCSPDSFAFLPGPLPSGNHPFVLFLWDWFCFVYSFILLFCFKFHMEVEAYGVCPSLSDRLHSEQSPPVPSVSSHIARFHPFLWPRHISLWTYFTPHIPYPFIYWWTPRLSPHPGYASNATIDGVTVFSNCCFHVLWIQA